MAILVSCRYVRGQLYVFICKDKKINFFAVDSNGPFKVRPRTKTVRGRRFGRLLVITIHGHTCMQDFNICRQK